MKTLNELREQSKSKTVKDKPSTHEIPNVLMLKRKSIRDFPDGLTVGLYYSDRLKRYISIPFGKDTVVDGTGENA